jgi:hypothetical protein
MNPNTGKVYSNPYDIEQATKRGESLIPVSERTADIIKAGRQARRAGLISARQQRKQRKAAHRLEQQIAGK